jgi:hypothetical protein
LRRFEAKKKPTGDGINQLVRGSQLDNVTGKNESEKSLYVRKAETNKCFCNSVFRKE